MSEMLYQWPAGARFGASVPKERFYERTASTGALSERFVAEVSRIRWAYKLAVETINLPGSPAVPEIEVLELDAKTNDISVPVLAWIDRAIPNPVIFEIYRGDSTGRTVRMAAAHKPVGSSPPALSAYFSTAWTRDNVPRAPLPLAITLEALYAALIGSLTPLALRPGESASDLNDRLDAVRQLEREINALERRLRSEPQLNRKVGIRRELKEKRADLEHLR